MQKLLISFLVLLVLSIASCTQCTTCEYYYVPSASLDTVRGEQLYCGSKKVVEDFEEYYKEEIQTQAGYSGTSAQITCTRTQKP